MTKDQLLRLRHNIRHLLQFMDTPSEIDLLEVLDETELLGLDIALTAQIESMP